MISEPRSAFASFQQYQRHSEQVSSFDFEPLQAISIHFIHFQSAIPTALRGHLLHRHLLHRRLLHRHCGSQALSKRNARLACKVDKALKYPTTRGQALTALSSILEIYNDTDSHAQISTAPSLSLTWITTRGKGGEDYGSKAHLVTELSNAKVSLSWC